MTFIETVLAIAILAVMMLPMVQLQKFGFDIWQTQENESELLANARLAMNRVKNELRYGIVIVTVGPDIVEFDSPYLVDADPEWERVKYEVLVGGVRTTDLYRSVANPNTAAYGVPPALLAKNVSSFTVTFPAPGFQVEDGLVEIRLIVTVGNKNIDLQSLVHMRNA